MSTKKSFSSENKKIVAHTIDILRALDAPLSANTKLLDLGCGDGELVQEFRKNQIPAFGADLPEALTSAGALSGGESKNEIFKSIQWNNEYHVPFPDESFDTIISLEVLEHVHNPSQVFSEISRMLKPGGTSLHVFPARWSPLEAHTNVPLGGIFQNYAYLLFWSMLGVRNRFQKGFNSRETAQANFDWLKKNTNYLKRKMILNLAKPYFFEAFFVEDIFMKFSPGRPSRIYTFKKVFPFLPNLFGALRKTVLFTRKAP